jgi:hypothetical protein
LAAQQHVHAVAMPAARLSRTDEHGSRLAFLRGR